MTDDQRLRLERCGKRIAQLALHNAPTAIVANECAIIASVIGPEVVDKMLGPRRDVAADIAAAVDTAARLGEAVMRRDNAPHAASDPVGEIYPAWVYEARQALTAVREGVDWQDKLRAALGWVPGNGSLYDMLNAVWRLADADRKRNLPLGGL